MTLNTHLYKGIPAMSSPALHAYLTELGEGWTGQGTAIELGCWLGATSRALLDGLILADYNRKFWAFDRWESNEGETKKARARGMDIKLRQDLSLIYSENIQEVYTNVRMVQGTLPNTLNKYGGHPIEICIFDAPKRERVFLNCIKRLLPYCIPGITVIGFLDFWFWKSQDIPDQQKYRGPERFLDSYSRHFEVIKDFKTSELFVKYVKELVL